MRSVILLVLLFGFWSSASQNTDLFKRGNTLYNEGKYEEAIEAYQKILDAGVHSAELYYNLANAHYKLSHIAPSIFYYEKALQLQPNDKDLQNNANFARNMTIDAIDTVPEVGFTRFFNKLINLMSYDAWAILAVLGVFTFVSLFLLYRFASISSQKRAAFVISALSLGMAIFAVFMAFRKQALEQADRPAIVFAQESRVNAEPNLRSEEAFRLHEGTKVQVLDTLKNWKKIRLSDGSTGWIPAEDIKLLSTF
jgi:tetratricopeptide (TPR) repeat protein